MNESNMQSHNIKVDKDEIDIAALVQDLIASKWIILLSVVVFIGLATVYLHKKVPQYASSLLLQIDLNRASGRNSLVSDQFNIGGGTSSPIKSQIALIQSRFILEPVVRAVNMNIRVNPIKQSFWDYVSSKSLSQKKINVSIFELPDNLLGKPFVVFHDRPNHIVLLDAAKNHILEGSIGKLLQDDSGKINLKVDMILGSVGSKFSVSKKSAISMVSQLSQRLKISEVGDGHTTGITGILDISLQGSNPYRTAKILNTIANEAREYDVKKKEQEVSQILRFLNQQIPVTKGELNEAELELNKYRIKTGKIEIKQQTQFLLNQISSLDNKLNELEISRIDMLQRYTTSHPAYISMLTQIKTLNDQRLQLEESLKTLPETDQEMIRLQRDITVKQNMYLTLLNKTQELQVIQAGTISSLLILSKATVSNSALSDHRFVVYMSSIILGFLFSIMFIYGRKLLLPRVIDPYWSEKRLNVPNLAIIPYSKEQIKLRESFQGAKHVPLLASELPSSLSIESLRSLRTALQVAMIGARNNVISVLGVAPSVGKSFISANLAYLLASAGKKVLVIDADLRRGSLHKYFGLDASPGLSETLAKNTSLDDAIQETMHPNLFCLPRGSFPKDPSELLTGSTFKSMVTELSNRYDIVLFDTAPILLVTDALIVSGFSGLNYIVYAAGAHKPEELEISMQRLNSVGIKLNGSIFNFHREQKKMSAYGYERYYSYTYKYDNDLK